METRWDAITRMRWTRLWFRGSRRRPDRGVLEGRRAHDRETVLVEADWHAFGSAVHHVSTTADVSPGGAFLCTAEPMAPGSPLVLELALPRGRIQVHARVAWSDPRGMGVRFTRRPRLEIT